MKNLEKLKLKEEIKASCWMIGIGLVVTLAIIIGWHHLSYLAPLEVNFINVSAFLIIGAILLIGGSLYLVGSMSLFVSWYNLNCLKERERKGY